MIIGYVGNLGSSKTLSLVRMAYSHYLKGHQVFSNIELNFPHESINFADLQEYATSGVQFQNAFFLIDEIGVSLDSRRSASKQNIVISMMILQSRKRGITIGYTSQTMQQVDIRLRQQTDIISICSKKLIKDILLCKNKMIIFRAEGEFQKVIRFVGNPYFPLYDTNEIVSLA